MKITISEKIDNPLLKRKEVKFSVDHEGKATPTKAAVANFLSAKLNAKKELMFIKKYESRFGTNTSSGVCLVYVNENAMNLVYETLLYRKLKNSESGDILEKGNDFGAGFS